MSSPRTMLALLLIAPVVAVAAGCGGDSGGGDSKDSASTGSSKSGSGASKSASGSSTAASGKLALAADPGGAIKFDKKALAAKAGKVTIAFTNASQTPHAVEIEGHGVEKETKTITGGSAALSATLKPGTYEFYCPVADHREEGMKGTLTVK